MASGVWKKVLGSKEEIKFEFSLGDRYVNFQTIPLIITVILAPIGLFRRWYLKRANKYAFTNKRVLIHKGWLSTHLTSVDYNQITDIRVEQSFLDRVVYKTGSLAINTAGTGFHEVVLEHIENPFEVRKKLEEIRGKAERS